jgi:hypothetical protein
LSEKRSASAENLAKCLATTRAAWKSSSLQRPFGQAVEVKCPRVNFIHGENPYQIEHLPPPIEEADETMVIRRAKRPQTELINCSSNGGSNYGVFSSRATNMRMTSFTENSEAETFMRNNAMPFPPQPRSLFESDSLRSTPVNMEHAYGSYGTYGVVTCQQHQPIKPVVSIAPTQLPPYPSLNVEERDSANYSIGSNADSSAESEFQLALQKNFL